MDAQPAVEREIALDIVKHGLMVAPVVVLVAGSIRGWDGAASAAIALGIVLVNFLARRGDHDAGPRRLVRPRSAAPRSAVTSFASP